MILSMFLALFLSFCNHGIFIKLNLLVLLVLEGSKKNHKNTQIIWLLTRN